MRFLISQKEQLQEIINHYGANHQKDKLFEEMAELQKEACKEKTAKAIYSISLRGWQMYISCSSKCN